MVSKTVAFGELPTLSQTVLAGEAEVCMNRSKSLSFVMTAKPFSSANCHTSLSERPLSETSRTCTDEGKVSRNCAARLAGSI
jgi:hypothetical protein